MKAFDAAKITRAFNEARLYHRGQKFSRLEMVAKLKEFGIGTSLFYYLDSLLIKERQSNSDRSLWYSFGDSPVHISKIKEILQKYQTKRSEEYESIKMAYYTEESAIAFLKRKGYMCIPPAIVSQINQL